MRRTRLHPLIAVLCALFLLGAQQAAYAHFLGHLGLGTETVVQEGGDADHGAASTLSHVCTTCAAFAALDSAPPPSVLAHAAERIDLAVFAGRPVAAVAAHPAPPYASRAPPAVL
ncbi:MAG: hypothetical protein Q7U97_03215 [Rhodocyclaceae bacterium]|nr:hypothetical protein [Rhodocyclaceae bacterium]